MADASIEQVLKNMQNFVGKDVIILEPNSHAGQKGKTHRAEIIQGKKKPAMIVQLESGKEINVYNPEQLFFILSETRVDRISEN